MDPNQTFLDMFEAMKTGDLETARERALALKRWFRKAGFYPYQYTPEAMHAYIASVLYRTTNHGADPVCSIICFVCDASSEFANEEQAMDAGWTEIWTAFPSTKSNFRGHCPNCRMQLERQL